jgi:phage terminase large subunit-like protein
MNFDLDELLYITSCLSEKDLEKYLIKEGGFQPVDLIGLNKDDLFNGVMNVWDNKRLIAKKQKITDEDYLKELARGLCQTSFEFFVRLFWDEVPGSSSLLWNWHMTLFCQVLEETASYVFEQKTPPENLVCNVPPGTSKTTIWTILFHPWVWTNMPTAKFITAGHDAARATDFASMTREVLKSELYRDLFPEIEISKEQDTKGHFRNTAGGERFIGSVGGRSVTGKHCHFAIIDDPIDPKQALEETGKKNAENYIMAGISTRRMRSKYGDVFVIMLVMQRLGVGDPTDVLLNLAKQGGKPVKHICLPAEITDLDNVSPAHLRAYYEGYNKDAECDANGLLDPVRLSRNSLKSYLIDLKPWGYAGQMLQAPRPLGGGMFKRHWYNQRVKAAPYNARRIRYWDRAASSSVSACATAGVLVAYDGNRIYIEDIVYGHWEPDERNAVMIATAQRDRLRYQKYEPYIYIERERGSTGKESFQYFARKLFQLGFTRVREDAPEGSKDERAQPFADGSASGMVVLVDNDGKPTWDIEGFLTDLENFRPTPGKKLGREKDRIDATSAAFNLFLVKRRMGPVLQTFNLGKQKNDTLRFVVCNLEEFSALQIDETMKCVVIYIGDPSSDPKQNTIVLQGENSGDPKPSIVIENGELVPQSPSPSYCQAKTLGTHQLNFADLDSANLQDKWLEPLEPWNQLPEKLVLQKEEAKNLWQFLLKKRDDKWGICIIVELGETDDRALSLAAGLADGYRLPRSVVYRPSDPDTLIADEVPNSYILEVVKSCRNLVHA